MNFRDVPLFCILRNPHKRPLAIGMTLNGNVFENAYLMCPNLCVVYNRPMPGGIIRNLCEQKGIELLEGHAMPDHVHLLLQGVDVIDFIRRFKGTMTPRAREMEPGRRLWQRSFFDHALRKEESLVEVARYIWENPVRAKMVKDPAEYPWSGSEAWNEWRGFYGRG